MDKHIIYIFRQMMDELASKHDVYIYDNIHILTRALE